MSNTNRNDVDADVRPTLGPRSGILGTEHLYRGKHHVAPHGCRVVVVGVQRGEELLTTEGQVGELQPGDRFKVRSINDGGLLDWSLVAGAHELEAIDENWRESAAATQSEPAREDPSLIRIEGDFRNGSPASFLDTELGPEAYPAFEPLMGDPGPTWMLTALGPCEACKGAFEHVGTLGENAVLKCKKCGLYWTIQSDVLIPGSSRRHASVSGQTGGR